MRKLAFLFIVVAGIAHPAKAAFTHPGIPLTTNDLNAVKAKVEAGAFPWKQGYDALAADSHSQLDYTMQGPFAEVGRNVDGTGYNPNRYEWINDMTAVFNLSRMWYFTGNTNYASKARDILVAWANTQTNFYGYESNLDLGDQAYRYAGGADILRGTWSGWTQADTEAVSNLFATVYWNGAFNDGDALGPANKGALSMVAGLSIATFCDDQQRFDHCLHLLRTAGPSGFQNTLPTGQIGESLRDQGHAYGEWLSFATMAEIFWKQGIDVYSELDNRLLAVGEYHARFNLGLETPYLPYGTTDRYYLSNTYTNTWPNGQRGYSLILGAYQTRLGLSAPYVEERLNQLPVNADSFTFLKASDHSTASPPPASSVPVPVPVSTGLSNADIGGSTPAGSGVYGNGIWTVKGAGSTIYTDGADSFHFVYLPVTNNCSVVAKVLSLDTNLPNAKAAVMIRETLDADTTKAWVGIKANHSAEFYISSDWTALRGGSNYAKGSRTIPSFPYWIKAERIDDTVALYISPDGTSWACIGNAVFGNMGDTAYIGLAVSSGSNGALNTSAFSHVRMTGGDGGGAVTVPEAPYYALATPDTQKAILRWIESADADSYNVKRSIVSGGPYTTVATGITNASYVDTGLLGGTNYYYVVSAVNSAGESADSPEAATTPESIPDPKLAGTVIGTTGTWSGLPNYRENALDGDIDTAFDSNLSYGGWVGLDLGEPYFISRIRYVPRASHPQRMIGGVFQGSNNGSSWTTLFTVTIQPTVGVYTEQAIADTNTYRYVRYYGPSGGNCNVAEIEFYGGQYIIPAPPTGLVPASGDQQVSLSWNPIADASSYKLKTSLNSGGPFSLIAHTSNTNFVDLGLTNGTTYHYVVSAVGSGGDSNNSAETNAIPSSSIIPGEYIIAANAVTAGNHIELTLSNSVPGHRYQVLASDSLTPTDWQPTGVSEAGNGSNVVLTLPISGMDSNRFFKLDVQRL